MDNIDICLGRFYSCLGFFLKGVDHPYISADLDGIENTESIPFALQRNFEHAAVNALDGLALSDLLPSAAIVSAASISLCTSSGKPSKSLRAALIREIGRVFLI